MVTPEQKATLMALLSSHPVAVVATASVHAEPAAAVVLYAEQDDMSLMFGTHQTKKYQNLLANPAAAFAVTKGMQAIQMHGQAVPADDQTEAKAVFSAKHPDLDEHIITGSIFFRFTPTWVRFLDYSAQPPVQWEVTLE